MFTLEFWFYCAISTVIAILAAYGLFQLVMLIAR